MTASRPLSFLLMLLGLLCVLTTAPARASSQDLLGSLGIETQPRFLKVDQAFIRPSPSRANNRVIGCCSGYASPTATTSIATASV